MPKPPKQAKPFVEKPSFSWKQYCSPMALLIVIVAITAIVDSYSRAKGSVLDQADPARTKGHFTAKLKIIAFVDFQNPDSAQGQAVLREYLSKYPQDIYWTVKYYSIGHLNSTPAFLYAQCAAQQNHFFDYQGALFILQPQWNNAPDVENFLMVYAKKLGLDLRRVKNCVDDDNTKAVIFRETALGAEHAVKTVPTYFINKEMVVGSEGLRKYLAAYFP